MVRVLICTDTRYPVNRKVIKKAIEDTLKGQGISSDCEVSVSVVGERKIRELAIKHFGEDELHDVISFPLEEYSGKRFVNLPDGILRLGDIVLCWPQVIVSASKDDIMVDEEVYNLTSHSVLHLLGKHHE